MNNTVSLILTSIMCGFIGFGLICLVAYITLVFPNKIIAKKFLKVLRDYKELLGV